MSNYQVFNPNPGQWVIQDPGINIHVVAGKERAILMDTGFGGEGLKALAEEVTGLPVELYHTHAHGDHVNGDNDWTDVWLHRAEWESYSADHDLNHFHIHEIEDGMKIDLGGRTLEVIHVPGHSPGSVAFLDREHRILFGGDTVMTQPVFLMFQTSSLKDYAKSLTKLQELKSQIDFIYPTHRKWPITPDAIDYLKDCADRALAGDTSTQVEFKVNLVFSEPTFLGYEKNGYHIAVKELSGESIPGVS